MDVKSGIPLVHREPRTRGGVAIRFSLYKYAQYADIRWATEVHVLQASPLVHLDGVPYVEVPATVTWVTDLSSRWLGFGLTLIVGLALCIALQCER